MPRDLASSLSKKDTVDSMPQLDRENAPDALPPPQITKSPDEATPYDDEDGDQSSSGGGGLFDQIANQRNEKRDVLHPYTQTLTLNDVESCVRLEEATFPAHERCSREKVSGDFPSCLFGGCSVLRTTEVSVLVGCRLDLRYALALSV